MDQTLLANSITKMQELNTIIDRSPVIAYKLHNEHGKAHFEYISENISQFGYKPDDFYNFKVSQKDFIHPDDIEIIREGLKSLLEKKGVRVGSGVGLPASCADEV